MKLLKKFCWFCELKCPLVLTPSWTSGVLLTLTYKFAPSIITYTLAQTKLPKMSFHLDQFPASLGCYRIALLTQESLWQCLL